MNSRDTIINRGGSQEALNAWIDLREQPRGSFVLNDGKPGPAMVDRIGKILDFLGLPYRESTQFSLRDRGRGARNNWVYLTFESAPPDQPKGAPLFGSQADGVYDVFCFWDARPDRIWHINPLSRRSTGNQNAVILLYMDALTVAERNEVKRHSWERDQSVAVVDEALMEFLAGYDGDVFKAFLQTTLPYTAANPYNEVTTGWSAKVRPEMFYGRERLARDLRNMQGGNCVFGGRQLGKTSLLQHVKSLFHMPEERHYAWFIDLKDKGYVPDSDKRSDDIGAVILEELVNEDLISQEEADRGKDDINRALRRLFQRDPQLRVLAMFDEADAFLEKDRESGFGAIESMRVAIRDCDNKVKVVFAGLHSVQRYARVPNNPFPTLGFDQNSPRRGGIGPLSYGDAQQLVEEPFSVLGFRFDDLAVDRILSYTHCHPSLTQFFCHQLIETFRKENVDANPPFTIRREDVDRVSGMRNIQNGIKLRFEATFELDPKYHAICLAMLSDPERDSQRWILGDVWDLCQSWWPSAFGDEVMPEQDLKSLLDELIGLGILVEDGNSYRMRSPLITRMFGSEDEILDSMEKLALH